ncbi:TIGR03557 family F420-dependent LLM class oxidoreductase [Desertimonas flava]|jgi:G6PDH family F420-dependent oxidoreductase|uniref:TIGR03557 family F420-dependent LLM class oxidoreductase n=1 Tax=Desertimonas flava TaxID=2064846 RepID=UPI000E341376|nr:TIGR03557 family F420-dependent LLM class oxidoreductase [Desertimonas flava]
MSSQRVRLGWWLSSEERSPRELVADAELAERAGFTTAMISDHLQPWAVSQGHAGHVWTTIGAIAASTDRLEVGTGVTAMVHRSHPVMVAHAAATAAILLEGRFFLGVGTGERLNEQAFGGHWPRPGERRRRLQDAIEIVREVWKGGQVNIENRSWTVERFELQERPATPPPIYVAAAGPRSARVASTLGDGLISVSADASLVDVYRGTGGTGPAIAQVHVSLADSVEAARSQAWHYWPNGAVATPLLTELARPEHIEAAAQGLRPEAIERTVVCATGATPVVAAIDRFVAAGYDTVYLHQIGPDQARLAALAADELLPHFER